MSSFIDNMGFPHDSERKKIVAEFYRKQLEIKSGLTILEIVDRFDQEKRFYFALKHLTVTCSVISAVFGNFLPQKNNCRYKAKYEANGLLVASIERVCCPYTTHPANLLTTNPREFGDLLESDQLGLFD